MRVDTFRSASTVTRGNYIETLLGARDEVVSKLRLPDRVVMRATKIADHAQPQAAGGKVLEMRR